VPAGARITLDVEANNSGQWALHCHGIYPAESGVLTVPSYVT